MSELSKTVPADDKSPTHRQIGVGVIGVGNWALHGPLLALDLLPDDYKIVSIYSQRLDAALGAASEYGIDVVASTLDELLGNPDVDLVLVLTTGPQHEAALRAAIAAGKDVYCEWPLTPTAAATAELVELAQAAGVQTILATQRRFSPAVRYAKDLIAEGYVGRVRSVRMDAALSAFGETRPQSVRWSAVPGNYMGSTSIAGAHTMDPLFSIVGRPTEISAISVNDWPTVTIAETGEEITTDVPDQLVMSGFLHSGALFSLHIEGGKLNGSGLQISITGDAGDLTLSGAAVFQGPGQDYRLAGAKKDAKGLAPLSIPESYHWHPASSGAVTMLELSDLFKGYVRDRANGSHTVPTFADGLFLQRLLDQAAESSRTGQRLKITF